MLCDHDTRLTEEQVIKHTWIEDNAPNSEESLLKLNMKILKNFSNSNKFFKAVLTFIATIIKDDEIHRLRDIFFSLDKNNDGILTFEEMKEGCKKLNSYLFLEEIFNSLDTNKSRSINYTEFIAATIDKKIYLKMRDYLRPLRISIKIIVEKFLCKKLIQLLMPKKKNIHQLKKKLKNLMPMEMEKLTMKNFVT
jgi:hypothetical protein